jgi:hypothetical protein
VRAMGRPDALIPAECPLGMRTVARSGRPVAAGQRKVGGQLIGAHCPRAAHELRTRRARASDFPPPSGTSLALVTRNMTS